MLWHGRASAPFECTDCGNRKRVEVPIPDVRARVAAIELLLREGLGRPAQAEEPPALPLLPRSEAEARALDWDELKALMVAYPEIECLPEGKRKQWLVSRWVDSRRPNGTGSGTVVEANQGIARLDPHKQATAEKEASFAAAQDRRRHGTLRATLTGRR
jgi:hypothetical protein